MSLCILCWQDCNAGKKRSWNAGAHGETCYTVMPILNVGSCLDLEVLCITWAFFMYSSEVSVHIQIPLTSYIAVPTSSWSSRESTPRGRCKVAYPKPFRVGDSPFRRVKMRKTWWKFEKKWWKGNFCPPGTVRLATPLTLQLLQQALLYNAVAAKHPQYTLTATSNLQ